MLSSKLPASHSRTAGPPTTTYGVVVGGPAVLECEAGSFELKSEMYFSVVGDWSLRGGSGLCVDAPGYEGVFQLGGPIEAVGRLRYIDGCTDSLLLGPLVCGDPCSNFRTLAGRVYAVASPSSFLSGWRCSIGSGCLRNTRWRVYTHTRCRLRHRRELATRVSAV